MFNGKLSRLVVNQKKKWQTLRFVCQTPDENNSYFPHCALPWPQYTTSCYLSFSSISINVCAEQWFVMDITFDWYTKLHHCFLLSWKSSKTLHEWFNVNLDVNSTWFELGFCYMNFAWNISFFKWNLYTCKSSKHGTIIKYIDSIGKKALNTFWMLFCCTSNSKINCKFNMNLLAKQLFDDVTSSPWDFWNMFEQMLFKK